MNSEKNYGNAPADIVEAIEQAEMVPDFLPAPDQLVPPEGLGPLRRPIVHSDTYQTSVLAVPDSG